MTRQQIRHELRIKAAQKIFDKFATVTSAGTFYQSDMPRRVRRLMARRMATRRFHERAKGATA